MLNFMESLYNKCISLRLLSVKLAILLILTTGQRCQAIKAMNITNMEINSNYVKIRVGEILKQTKPQHHLEVIYIEAFNQNSSICVVKALQYYIQKTKNIHKDFNLFIITQKPHSVA